MRKRLFGTALLVFLLVGTAAATSFIVYDDRELVRRSDAIVIGAALTSYPTVNEHGTIETVTPFSIEEVIKGNVGRTLDVRTIGGRYGDVARIVASAPQFAEGERVVLFLHRGDDGEYRVTDLALGRFNFAIDANGNSLLVRAEEDIVGWSAKGGVHVEPRRSASQFLEFVRNEVRGLRPEMTYFVKPAAVRALPNSVSFNPTVNVASTSATSYTMDLQQTAGGTGLGGRWNQFPRNLYTQASAPAAGITALTTTINAWNNDCLSNVQYVHAGTDPCSPSCHTEGIVGNADGFNTVLFERNLSNFGTFSCTQNGYGGLLGLGGITLASGTHSGPGSETFFTTVEVDVEMNTGTSSCASLVNSGDFNTGVAHEVGHTLGFRHSDKNRATPEGTCVGSATFECSSSAIMKAFIPNGLNAVLQEWDQNAVRTLYPGNICNPNTSNVDGDFNADSNSDVVWRHTSGSNYLWFMASGNFSSASVLPSVTPTTWQIQAVGDFNGDGRADLFWRETASGTNYVWLMNGSTVTTAAPTTSVADPAWNVVGAGDFNNDGMDDLFWRRNGDGQNYIWLMNGSTATSATSVFTLDTTWTMAGIRDMTADGKSDIVWRRSTTGENYLWTMNGSTISAATPIPAVTDTAWTIVAVNDFNNDDMADLFWRNTSNGQNYIWLMNSATPTSVVPGPTVADTAFQVFATGDYNADGNYDLFWRHTGTGSNYAWLMNGTSVTAVALPVISDTGWTVRGPR